MLTTKMPKVLIVGGGLTGSLVAASLFKITKENARNHLQLSIWDKARGTGNYIQQHNVIYTSSFSSSLYEEQVAECRPAEALIIARALPIWEPNI